MTGPRVYNSKPNSTSFKKGHKKVGGISKGDKMSESAKEKIRKSLLGKVGEKSRNWRGGLTGIRRLLPSLVLYHEWRGKVFKRDDYTCRGCGERGCYLEAHHIIPLKVLIRENNLKTSEDAIKCKALWDVSNGLSLCKPCHKETDSFAHKANKKYV